MKAPSGPLITLVRVGYQMSKVVQCELREVHNPKHQYHDAAVRAERHTRVMVTWLEADKGIKPGDHITLKDMPDAWWLVETVGRQHERSDIKRGWGMTDYFGKEADRQ